MSHVEQLRVLFGGELVGSLTLYRRQYWFQYDANWLQHGFDLAPTMMNFDNAPQLAKLPVFQGLHGVFYDSLPDGWGLLLMDRFFKKQFGWDAHQVTALDRLAYIGHRAMGALEYEPVISSETIKETIQLDKLAEEAERILAGKSKDVLNQLRILGGSPGGARPKVTLALAGDSEDCVAGQGKLPTGFRHWLVKFHSQSDSKDMGCIERTYAELATLAGLEMPPSRLIEVQHADKRKELFYAVQRFDRTGDIKHHMLTLGGYLYADFRLPALDYNALLAATAVLTKDMREVQRAFRLMVFNVVTHNKDDHAKNFAFICDRPGAWRLAPGYDLTFSTGMNNEHATAINGNGHPTKKDLAVIAEAHSVHDWEAILAEVLEAASHWQVLAKQFSVSNVSQERIAKSLNKIGVLLK